MSSSGVSTFDPEVAGPRQVELHVMSGCDNTCIACWNHAPQIPVRPRNPEERRGPMPLDAIERLCDDLETLGTKTIMLSGAGEPFLHPKIWDVIKAIKSRGFELQIVTYALPAKTRYRELTDLGVNKLIVSLWAGTPEGYARTHPGKSPETFLEIVSMLKDVARYKKARASEFPKVDVFQLVCRQNANELRELAQVGFDVDANAVIFDVADIIEGVNDDASLRAEDYFRLRADFPRLPLEPIAAFSENAFFEPKAERYFHHVPRGFPDEGSRPSREILCAAGMPGSLRKKEEFFYEFDKAFCADCGRKSVCPVDQRHGMLLLAKTQVFGLDRLKLKIAGQEDSTDFAIKPLVDAIPCAIGYTFSRVNIDGSVKLCCKSYGIVLGNIFEQGFREIWTSHEYKRMREHALNSKKSAPPFVKVGCYRSCDNLEMNKAFARPQTR
ncbi:MAG: radical SAM protein [Planctomycetes bacterium]|nr:radical SAM protein [Planctomycetota bacterium]